MYSENTQNYKKTYRPCLKVDKLVCFIFRLAGILLLRLLLLLSDILRLGRVKIGLLLWRDSKLGGLPARLKPLPLRFNQFLENMGDRAAAAAADRISPFPDFGMDCEVEFNAALVFRLFLFRHGFE